MWLVKREKVCVSFIKTFWKGNEEKGYVSYFFTFHQQKAHEKIWKIHSVTPNNKLFRSRDILIFVFNSSSFFLTFSFQSER